MRLLKDSCGRKSWHVTLAVPVIIVASISFLIGGIDVTLPGGTHILTASRSGTDFGVFLAPFFAALGWRDYLKRDEKTNVG